MPVQTCQIGVNPDSEQSVWCFDIKQEKYFYENTLELRQVKTCFLHMRKQKCRSSAQ